MKLEIVEDKKNGLLNRREVSVIISADSNPGFAKAQEVISSELKASDDSIVVRNVKSKFGRDTFLISAFIYDSVADKERVEPKKKEKKEAA